MASKNRIIKLIDLIAVILTGMLLYGCANDPLNFSGGGNSKKSSWTPDLSFGNQKSVSGYYRVKSGDTLFSIAFKYGLNYKAVAALNNIPAPYVIYPKQKIRLTGEAKTVNSPVKKSAKTSTKLKNTPINTVKSNKKQSTVNIKNQTTKTASNSKRYSKKALNWVWPVSGEVIKGFSNKGVSSKGIDIKGKKNGKVVSASDGIVVYAGNGLIGYGNLVIVKHSDEYLSAYAYNQEILVKEQQSVKAGQKLAIIGGKGAQRSLLHFEVRKDGQPINPLKVLPK